MKKISLVFCILILSSALFGQNVTKVGTTSATFLTIPVGPRATAMGGAIVAISSDASATYWNPGALSLISEHEVHFMHSDYFADIYLNYISATFKMSSYSAIGLSVVALNMPEMAITTVDDPEGLSGARFDAGSYAVGLSYGHSLTDRFSIGATAKYITEKILNSTATSFAVDIGTVYQTPFEGIRLGVSITNFGPKMQISGEDLYVQTDIDPSIAGNNESVNATLNTDQFDLPLGLQIGLAYDPIKTEDSRLTVTVDGLHPNDNSESINLGAEYAFLNETLFLRGGYRNLFQTETENTYTMGFGIFYKTSAIKFKLDYAFAEHNYLQGIHQFGITLAY